MFQYQAGSGNQRQRNKTTNEKSNIENFTMHIMFKSNVGNVTVIYFTSNH